MRVSDRGANGGHLKQADSELLGVADAAAYLNTSERHVRRLRAENRLRSELTLLHADTDVLIVTLRH